ncbi:MAG: glycine--tRNA ligase subunit beta [Xanthomonadales bacterium]|nr:Glycine--tRNA ligase beta subunit [Xanthomonadales bacterium]MCC6594052.1 glycine--tRNA ligase subunit beta [Xanthomonadales bacterium]MCE7931709.1 glycine--tRNA ligase subunit beta [Xanthomonadales bacterium PRO6]
MTTTADLLVELLTEELPAKAVADLATGLRAGLCERLAKAGIAHPAGRARALWTPRRIAVLIPEVALAAPEQTLERRGPALAAGTGPDGAPSKALVGFAASCGVSVDALEKLETDKGAWFVHRSRKPGAQTADVLPGMVEEAIKALPQGKPMRWGDNDFAFLRPVHGLIVLLGDEVLPASVYGVASGKSTRGHRFHHAGEVSVARPADYESALLAARVIADPDARRERVRSEVAATAQRQGGVARLPEDLVDEVSNLTEWPCAIACSIPAEFMRLPDAVIVTTIETHQRFFPVLDAGGKLTPHFIGVANIESRDADEIRKGYERVVRPRLADAGFFYDQDLRQPLTEHVEGLKLVTYQQKLGTLHDKTTRVIALARVVAPAVGVDPGFAEAAARLAKADLLTRMVGEFPELQGQMGRTYALAQGQPEALAIALDEVYAPRQSGAPIAASPLGRVLAIAERLDTLAGIFAVGLKPTGNKDPFALRRAALGLARTLIEGGVRLDLPRVLEQAVLSVPAQSLKDYLGKLAGVVFHDSALIAKLVDELTAPAVNELYEFILERTRAWYTEAGITADVFEAVAARRPHDLVDFDLRLKAVLAFKQQSACQSLAAANKRIRNILRKASEGGIDVATLGPVESDRLHHDAEKALYLAIGDAERASAPHFAASDYVAGLTRLATLQAPVDAFFDGVMVMAGDVAVRDNRLALLEHLSRLFLQVADVSLLVG